MPKAYSDDLRLRAVWLHVFLGYNIEDTSGMLAMSPSSVKRFKKKFVRTGEVVAKKTGRPLDLVGMHLREELVMMEAMLEHPEKTLTEIVREIMTVFGNRFQGVNVFAIECILNTKQHIHHIVTFIYLCVCLKHLEFFKICTAVLLCARCLISILEIFF